MAWLDFSTHSASETAFCKELDEDNGGRGFTLANSLEL
jgi:hypothetical protein